MDIEWFHTGMIGFRKENRRSIIANRYRRIGTAAWEINGCKNEFLLTIWITGNRRFVFKWEYLCNERTGILVCTLFKSRRPSLYEQQRDTFIDQVITKIWAFQWNVYGLGDPSDWKSINAIQLPTNTHKLKATTEYYAWTSILVDSTLVDPSSILSPSSSQSSSIPSLEYLPLIPSHHSYRISRISCSTFVSSRTSLVSCSSNSTSRSLQ